MPKQAKLAFPLPSSFSFAEVLSNKPWCNLQSVRTIVRVWLNFVSNYCIRWYFYYANFASSIDFYGNIMVTLPMVPDLFEGRARAHLIAFKQRKQMMTGESQFWPIPISITNAWPVSAAKIGVCTLFNSILTDPRTDAQRTDRVL